MKHLNTQVLETLTPWGITRHLKVWRDDGKSGISWDELQELKNEVLGPTTTAVEIYPAQSDLVNEVNMRHLWEVPPGISVPNLAKRW